MEERLKLSRIYIIATLAMIVIGIVALVVAFIGDPQRAWANTLLNNVYFVSLAVGAVLFLVHTAGHPFGMVGRLYPCPGSHGSLYPCGCRTFPGDDTGSQIPVPLVTCRCGGP